MKAVRHKTGRLVYREEPEFKPGYGIINAVLLGCGTEDELEEVEVTEKEWENECKLREQEEPPTLEKQVDKLEKTLEKLDERVKQIEEKDKVKE